jgi:hypothetical protein
MPYRWTRHRVCDAAGKDKSGFAAISLLAVARAAAEETLQGSPMASAWLKLFRTQLSETDGHWLRWRGDLAESAELRRAYSGLYGRFFARALLTDHLRLSRFLSLKRNGLEVPDSVTVKRMHTGDIPDWLAWDDANARFVLCEAKGSLSATDFLKAGMPRCVHEGKKQFLRISCHDQGQPVYPAEWVAASRWATDQRGGDPVSLLWDPPVDDAPFSEEEAARHREAVGRAWLESIAPGMGWGSAEALRSGERRREALVVRVKPGPVAPGREWPATEDRFDDEDELPEPILRRVIAAERRRAPRGIGGRDDLLESGLYSDRSMLDRPEHENAGHEREYVASLVTRFGIRPVRSREDYDLLLRAQDEAHRLKEPAMIVALPVALDPAKKDKVVWRDEGGIASTGGLAIFDLRLATAEPLEGLPVA